MRSVSAPEGETPSALMTSERRRALAPSRPRWSQDLPLPPPPLNVSCCQTQTILDGTLQDVNLKKKKNSGQQLALAISGAAADNGPVSCEAYHVILAFALGCTRAVFRTVSRHHRLSVKAQHPDTDTLLTHSGAPLCFPY